MRGGPNSLSAELCRASGTSPSQPWRPLQGCQECCSRCQSAVAYAPRAPSFGDLQSRGHLLRLLARAAAADAAQPWVAAPFLQPRHSTAAMPCCLGGDSQRSRHAAAANTGGTLLAYITPLSPDGKALRPAKSLC